MPAADGGSAGSDQKSPTPNPPDAKHGAPTAPATTTEPKSIPSSAPAMTVELDDFGLPIRKYTPTADPATPTADATPTATNGQNESNKDESTDRGDNAEEVAEGKRISPTPRVEGETPNADSTEAKSQTTKDGSEPAVDARVEQTPRVEDQAVSEARKPQQQTAGHQRNTSAAGGLGGTGVSDYSHQHLTGPKEEQKEEEDDDGGWQPMPAYAPYDIYDDNNKLIAKEYNEADDNETYGYAGLGGAGKGYTKVLLDDDAESVTSMDEYTQYLFKDTGTAMADEDDTQRDAVSQLQATKDLLTEGQRIAYVGLTRLELSAMLKEAEAIEPTPKAKKYVTLAAESMKMWGQKMMIRLYTHMDISPDEQVMIEQLSSHGVMPRDLTPVLMANARVKNPMAAEKEARSSVSTQSPSRPASVVSSARESSEEPLPPYSAEDDTELTAPVKTPSQMPTTQNIDIDIRWTVLCDLFLVLTADSIYDARSRSLLERVAQDLEVSWLDICRFEKKVTDALEMQQNAETENWNEEEHMEQRRKRALKRRYMMMGLATVGGGLVIGLSAGILAPAIGAGLAAGFTAIGVSGTSGFLAGAGGAAIITSTAAASGGIIGVRAANRRTGAVKTFEYRPLNNNKRMNLIVTVSGWMTGKVDDIRLPFSTVDPVMGDIYSVLWEPELLASIGDTINILATEALTQGLQQILASTVLMGLMSALQAPIILTKLSYLIDNPWAVSLDRATAAGLILADSLVDRNLGTRPVTLVGYSLGSRVIFSCLQELAKKGAFGLVQNVYLFGSPVVVKKDEYLRARAVVSGRFVNGYNRNDWILGYLFRLTSGGIRRVAGLAAIQDIPGVENMDVSEFVVGHMDYRTAMPRLLRECGWLVESDEFTEIEDPDPDNHQERQRELINEIEEARRELEREGKSNKGGAFGFFRRKKPPQRQEWEVYEETGKGGGKGGKTDNTDGNNHGVLFDVDAIRAEIAKEHSKQNNKDVDNPYGHDGEQLLQVREIKSTLPPIKVELPSSSNASSPGAPPPPAARTPQRNSTTAEPTPSPPRPSWSSASPTPLDCGDSKTHHRVSRESARDRTATFPSSSRNPYAGYGYGGFGDYGYGDDVVGGGGDGNDGITMTFDTGFDDDRDGDKDRRQGDESEAHATSFAGPTSTSTTTTTAKTADGLLPSSSSSWSAPGDDDRLASSEQPATARPELIRSAQTLPNISLKDPWADYGADDDDDDFGKEKEISLTFA
ncbi:hypothetical protein VTK26DRAFT_9126 [Humicola hyalothermophila]